MYTAHQITIIVTATAILAFIVTIASMMLLPMEERPREHAWETADRAVDRLEQVWRESMRREGWRWLAGRRYHRQARHARRGREVAGDAAA